MRLIDEQDVINRIVSVRHRIRKYKELGNEIIGFAEQVLTDVQTRVNCCPTTIPEFIDVSEVPPKFPCLVLTKDEPHCPVWCEEFVRRTHGQTKEVTYGNVGTSIGTVAVAGGTGWFSIDVSSFIPSSGEFAVTLVCRDSYMTVDGTNAYIQLTA